VLATTIGRRAWHPVQAARGAGILAAVRIDHVEISVPRGTLTDDYCRDLDQLLTGILGWRGQTNEFVHPIDQVDRRERVYRFGDQSVVLNEADDHFGAGTDDHFGVVVSSAELDRIFTACEELASRDPRLELRYVVDGAPSRVDLGSWELRALFVRYLVPRWIDIQSHDATS
jgi:hypothetical protein